MLLTNEKKENGKENRIAPAFLFFLSCEYLQVKRINKDSSRHQWDEEKGKKKDVLKGDL